jgi:1-aminocyclopropane-1-carboxylate deaminase
MLSAAISGKPELQVIHYPPWMNGGVEVSVLRDDLVHPYLGGNKGRKLKYNLEVLERSGRQTIVTFGGAFSNHLVAVAAASRAFGFNAVGIVRGERVVNPYLAFMQQCGMQLHFMARDRYRDKSEPAVADDIFRELVRQNFLSDPKEALLIPEGGANRVAVRGAGEIVDDVPIETDFIACACGTGATAAGISRKLRSHQRLIAIPVLKAPGFMARAVAQLDGDVNKTDFLENYHFGGYAKKEERLEQFCGAFMAATAIPVEPVYTGKLFYAMDDLIKRGYFESGKKVTLIHTGGIYNF